MQSTNVSNMNLMKATVSMLSLLALASCGGGGGGGSTPTTETPDTSPPVEFVPTYLFGSRAEYEWSNAIGSMNIIPVHEAGYSGNGIVVAVIDSGINRNHEEFVGKILPSSRDIITDTSLLRDANGHGTAMAGIIAAAGNGVGIIGIAPNSKLMILNAFDDGFYDLDVAEAIRYAVDNGAQVVNLSLGGTYPNLQVLDDAIQHAANNDVVLLFATGNEGNHLPAIYPARNVGSPEYGTTSLAVTALDSNDEIASFANPCDVYNPKYCVAALGVGVQTTSWDGGYLAIDGTSPATAVVSGTVALLLEVFPELSASEAVAIMLRTTDDLGEPGVDRIYGSGKVNIERAMQPVGTMNVANVQSENLPNESYIVVSGAFGDGLKDAAALKSISLFDEYQRHYLADFSAQVFENTEDQSSEALRGFYQFEYVDSDKSLSIFADFHDIAVATMERSRKDNQQASLGMSPFYEIADLDWQVGARKGFDGFAVNASLAQNWNDDTLSRLLSLSVELTPIAGLDVRLGASYLHEDSRLLGSQFAGAFGAVENSNSYSLEAGAHYQASIAQLYGHVSYTMTDVDFESNGLLSDAKRIEGSAWEIGAIADNVFFERDALQLSLRQDYHIEAGSVLVDDDAGFSQWMGLAPSDREIRAKLEYDYAVSDEISASIFVEGTHDEGNIQRNELEFAFGGAVEFQF